jgi:hypothetical protein
MRIIDAFTGRDVHVGDVVPSPGGEHDWQLMDIDDISFFNARIHVREVGSGRTFWMPLAMRLLHPNFLLQRVGFVPS